MTEAEWLACQHPQRMLESLPRKVSDRKLRLFACACSRRVWHLVSGPGRAAVAVGERVADGAAGRAEFRAAVDAAAAIFRAARPSTAYDPRAAGWTAARAVQAGSEAAGEGSLASTYRSVERAAQARLLRDIVGNPFRPPPPVPPCLLARDGGVVVALARAAYEDRLLPSGHLDPDRLAVLADALEEGGCCDPGLPGHLRGLGPHVRGCWCVDLLLGLG